MSAPIEFHPGAFRRGLRHAGLTHGEFRVAVEMSEYSTVGEPVVWPGVRTLAETCDMTRNGVQCVLKRLVAKHVIVCADLSANKGGRGHANRWRLLVAAEPERANHGMPFVDQERAKSGLPFNEERAKYGHAKRPTTDTERANQRWPEVVRSSSLEAGPPAHSLDEKRFQDLCASATVEPPDRSCKDHSHWDGPSCPRCGTDKRAFHGWLETSRRVLADLDRLHDTTHDPGLSAVIRSERRGRITVFQRLGEPWK